MLKRIGKKILRKVVLDPLPCKIRHRWNYFGFNSNYRRCQRCKTKEKYDHIQKIWFNL